MKKDHLSKAARKMVKQNRNARMNARGRQYDDGLLIGMEKKGKNV